MKRKLYTFIFLSLFSFIAHAQVHTSLTDIYMGNYGFWDYQSSGSLQALEQDSLNQQVFHSIYLTADSTFSAPSKRVLYFYSSNSGNNWISGIVDNVSSSYPSLALQSDGKAVICFLDSSASKIRLYRTITPGALTFDTLPSPPGVAGTNPKILYYKNYLIMFALFSGQLQKTRYNYLTSSWESWQIIGTNVSTAYQPAKGWNGKVAACWISAISQRPVNYVESIDSGSTFSAANTIFTQDITPIDTVRAFSHIDIVYFQNFPAITWDAVARIIPLGGQEGIQKFYQNPRIYFWNQANGVKIVADSSNNGSPSFPSRNTQLSMGVNWSTLCGPSIGSSGYSGFLNLYIGYSAVKTSVPFGNFWYDSDIFVKISNTNGANWNLYYTPATTDNTNDDRFVCMNKRANPNFGYSFAFVEQKDRFPGSFRAGDTTFITRAYPEFYLISVFVHTVLENGSDPDEYDLCPNYPNPFNASTHIEYWLPHNGHVKIDVYDLLGRNVKTLADGSELSSVGSSYVVFDGTNFPSGVYITRMFVDGKFIDAKKMVLIK